MRNSANNQNQEELQGELETLGARVAELERSEAERQNILEALQASEERFRTLIEQGGDAVFVIDMEGRILDVNRRACDGLGYTREELLEMNIAEVDTEVVSHEHRKQFWEKVTADQPITFEGTQKRKDGSTFPVEVRTTVLSQSPVRTLLGLVRDVTERKQTEQALRESEETYRQLFATGSDAIIVFDADTRRITDVNPAAQKLYEYSEKEFLELQVVQISAELEKTAAATDAAVKGNLAKVPLRYHRKKGGTVFPVEISPAHFKLNGRNVICGIIRDISERMQAEEALRNSEAKYRAHVENTPAITYVAGIDDASTTQYISPQVESILGFSPKIWVQNPELWKERLHPEDRDRVMRDVAASHAHGERFQSEYRMVAKDGHTVWFRDEATVVRSREGPPLFLQGVMLDITERKRAEGALRESETRLQQVANTIEDVFWMTDWSSKRTLFASHAYEKIWGRSLQDLYRNPHDWVDAIHPDDRQSAWEVFLHLGRAGTYDEEYRIVRPDGSVKWIRDRGFPVRDESGRVYRVVGIAQDITARKRAEEEKEELENKLRHAQKMEAVGQLAGGVAHDFNNVLTVIFGTVELLLPMIERGLDESSTEAAKSGLEEIKFAGQRAAALTRQLLAFGRKGMVKVEVLDLARVIHDAEKLLRRLLREDIVFDVNVVAGVPYIRADAGQIEQVMMNLVVNARDAMPSGGTLAVTCANVEVDEAHAAAHVSAKPGPYVMLAVSDTGVGMSKETMGRMFEPFFTTKPSGKGAGLGLATVYGIVRQTGAHITVESELDKGSVFTVYFPAVEEEAWKPETADSDQGLRGEEVILLCEDEKLVRRMSCQVLRAAGYGVLEAENGRHALDVAAGYEGRINLLISDVVMPKMNGQELAESMMQHYPGLPILFISGYTDDVLDGQVSRSDLSDFLQKPFTPTALLQHVRALLDR